MKTSSFIFIFLAACILTVLSGIEPIRSQDFDDWEEKTPITDSVSDNTNAHLAVIQYISAPMMNMVWENSTDDTSTRVPQSFPE